MFLISGNENDNNPIIIKEFLSDLIFMIEEIESEYLQNILKKDSKILAEKQYSYVKNLYDNYKDIINIEIVHKDQFGLNFAFKSRRGIYYFPAVLWYVQSYRTSKKKIDELKKSIFKNLSELENLISNIIEENVTSRKGYSIELLECLNFYTSFFSENEYNLENLMKFHHINYKPSFLLEFPFETLKNNIQSVKQTLNTLLIPNNVFWNLGSIIFDPFFEYDNLDYHYPLFPYWLIKIDNNEYIRIYRTSPEIYGNKFNLKNQIISKIDFFINFRNYSKSRSDLFSSSTPDLFKMYEIFEEQNFNLLNKNNSSLKGLKEPNWYISTAYSRKSHKQFNYFDQNENENVNQFLKENLDIIISLFNNSRLKEKVNIGEIIRNFERKNIFSKLFYKRLSISKPNFNIKLILFMKFDKNRLKKYKTNIINFFSSIFPTGVILDYNSGLMLYLFSFSENKMKFIQDLTNFLDFLNIEFKIYTDFTNFGFLVYGLPPSDLFIKGNWNFPNLYNHPSEKEFSKILPSILEKEKDFQKKKNNINRIEEFRRFINNL